MTPEEEALSTVLTILVRADLPYMLTGSVAASYYGRPRATHDADIVIDPTAQQLDALLERLIEAGFYVDVDGAKAALHRRSQFNVIETRQASKIDFIVRGNRPFSREEFSRRQIVAWPFGPAISIVSPEDAILSKLEWARKSGDSERQIDDAAHVVRLQPGLDRSYVERWAQELGVSDLWRRIAEPS